MGASLLSVIATSSGLQDLVIGADAPLLAWGLVALVQCMLIVAGRSMFSGNTTNKIVYIMAASFSVFFGIAYFLQKIGLEEHIAQQQFQSEKTKLADVMEGNAFRMESFQGALTSLAEYSEVKANQEKSTGGSCDSNDYVGEGPRYRLRMDDADWLKFHSQRVSGITQKMDDLTGKFEKMMKNDVNELRKILVHSNGLLKSTEIEQAKQWVDERIESQDHYDEKSDEYFRCPDKNFRALARGVLETEMKPLKIPEIHQVNKGSNFELTMGILHTLFKGGFKELTVYHLFALTLGLMVEVCIWFMLRTIHIKEKELRVKKGMAASWDGMIERYGESYDHFLAAKANARVQKDVFIVEVETGSNLERLITELSALDFAHKTRSSLSHWLARFFGIAGRHQRYCIDKTPMLDLMQFWVKHRNR